MCGVRDRIDLRVAQKSGKTLGPAELAGPDLPCGWRGDVVRPASDLIVRMDASPASADASA